jgi:muramidase (phage lysozyme)
LDSTAAGRYQLLERYYDAYKAKLNLPDFSPASQDTIALQQITERGAMDDIDAGRFVTAILKCANIWASLPGAPYGQRQQRLGDLLKTYQLAGGTLSST